MDEEAFRRQLLAEVPRLARVAHRLTPPGVDHEDLVQDVLERAWRSRMGFRHGSRLSTWLHAIMINRANDLTRRRQHEREEILEQDLLEFEIDDPVAAVERAEDAGLLRAALSRLSPLDRTVLVLHDGEQWTAGQVAEICGMSADAVHKRVQRARLRLARELAECPSAASVWRVSPACRRAREAASAYLEGELDPATRAAVDEHLQRCQRCPALIQALVGLRGALATSGVPVPNRLREAVRDAAAHSRALLTREDSIQAAPDG